MEKNLESNKQIIVSQESGTDEEKQNDATSSETVEQQCPSDADNPTPVMTEEQERQIAERYDDVGSFHDGLVRLELYCKLYCKEFYPVKYYASWFYEGLTAKFNGKWGLIDKTGKEVIPCKYDYVGRVFSEGLAYVELNGKWGYINTTGNEVVPLIYDFAETFSNGFARVKLDGEEFYIDTRGKRIGKTSSER
jgi:hypothetical protein